MNSTDPREAIIADWHDDTLSRRLIAEKHGVSESYIQTVWQDARGQKLLPRRHRTLAPDAMMLGADVICEPEFGDSQSGDSDVETFCIPQLDPLLVALMREHGKDARRRFDDVERHYRLSDYPSPAVLYALRRIHDVRMKKLGQPTGSF